MKERISYLVKKYLDGSASKVEEDELSAILRSAAHKDAVQEVLYILMQEEQKEEITDRQAWEDIFGQILASEATGTKPKKLRYRYIWQYAAAVVMVCLSAVYLYWDNRLSSGEGTEITRHEKDKIVPGKDRAMLVFPDSSHIDLSEPDAQVDHVDHIVSRTEEELVYAQLSDKDLGNHTALEDMHTIVVPKGGQYRIKLSDGTWVWLNADTEIKYVVGFAQDERRVELRGEAYFEVAEDTERPFKVYIDGEKHVQVLGTNFNVKAYRDESKVKTSLYQGAVEVFGMNDRKLLKPGQYAMADHTSGRLTAGTLRSDDDMAWRNGNFVFDGETIQEIMRKISRWYDVSIVYDGQPTDELFRGTISRFEDVREVLNVIGLTDIVTFKIEGRRIKVMKR